MTPLPRLASPEQRPRAVIASREQILEETGRALRRARRARGLTLRGVGSNSQGQFKPTAVAGYERRRTSHLPRALLRVGATLRYEAPSDCSRSPWRIGGGPEPIIDRRRLPDLPSDEAGTIGTSSRRSAAPWELQRRDDHDPDRGPRGAGHRDRASAAEFLEHLRPALIVDASRASRTASRRQSRRSGSVERRPGDGPSSGERSSRRRAPAPEDDGQPTASRPTGHRRAHGSSKHPPCVSVARSQRSRVTMPASLEIAVSRAARDRTP
jgi:hypothetical protein